MVLVENDFTKIYESFKNDAYRFAFSYLLNSQDAEDVLQDTFVYIWKNIDDASKINKSYIMQIIHNKCIDVLRKRSHFSRTEFDENIHSIIDQETIDLLESIHHLKEKYATILILHYFSNLSTKEIASTLKITQSNVTKRLERARTLLKEVLENEQN